MGEIFPGSQDDLRNFLTEKGYVLAYTVFIDDVFIRKDLYEGKYKPDPKMIEKFEATFDSTCSWEGQSVVEFYRVVTDVLHKKNQKNFINQNTNTNFI